MSPSFHLGTRHRSIYKVGRVACNTENTSATEDDSAEAKQGEAIRREEDAEDNENMVADGSQKNPNRAKNIKEYSGGNNEYV